MPAADGERVAIVTGGSRHLGRAFSLGLARAGYSTVVADIADASPVAEEIRAEGGRAEAVHTDVADPDSTEAMAAFALERFGRIDVLVNNAGWFKRAYRGAWDEIEVDEWDRSFVVNVRGVWLCARAVVGAMREQGGGKIVNIGSTTVWKGTPGFLHYVAAKSALIGLTRALARELGDDRISVNVLAPDYIPDDEMLRTNPAQNDFVISQRVFKRTQVPEDMIGALTFLAGPESDFMTGQCLLVNGGVWFN
jgi:NAD(P)-dependent dehydrogenase (short-subunit alcohol dehydrogenase family)